MGRRSGLGRGLSSLIPAEVTGDAAEQVDDEVASLVELPLSAVVANRHQPRKAFDDEALASLTASIRELGVLQPVLVRAEDDGTYELIAGERRWRAARRAGLDTIPAIVRTADDLAALEQAVVENLHRADLNAMEEAAAYQQLIEEFELTHEQVATRVGKSRVAVTNALRLFQLPASLQRMVAEGALTGGHAKALLGTPDRAFMEHLANQALAESLSVRQIEEAVRERSGLAGSRPADGRDRATSTGRASATKGAGGGANRDPGLLELEQLLAEFLDTRVLIQAGRGRGRLTVEFADLEDLERIYRLIASGPTDAADAERADSSSETDDD